MDPMEMISILEKHGQVRAPAHVWTFSGSRVSASRGEYSVTIEVHERPLFADTRYFIVARDEHGREASGNGADSLDVALSIVHWHRIDEAP